MEENRKSSIDEIVSGVHEALKSGELSDSELRIEFVEEEQRTPALVFEEDDEPCDSVQSVRIEEKAEDNERDTVSDTLQTQSAAEEQTEARVWTAYVPRFTEASLNYRMKGQSAPSYDEAPKVSVEPVEISEDSDDEAVSLDPTAEIENESADEATVVSSGASRDDGENTSTMFKFSSDEDKEPAECESAVSDELEMLEQALKKIDEAEKSDEPEAEEPSCDSEESEQEEVEAELPEPYSIPDPEQEEAKLPVPRAAAPLETVDEGIKGRTRPRSEYNSFSDTDGFLDKFIDGITSVRVRLLAAALLSLALLVIENLSLFGVDIVRFMNFDGISGAMTVITAPFILCIFALALPEVISSFTAIGKKKLSPELMVPLSFLITLVYYVIVVIYSSSDDYALVGFLFSITALSSIVATYYKKKADFIAFKLVSTNGEKKAVDKKLTRNLKLENIALDGKVETYKSRTARVFRTQFVSDFAGRSAVFSENSRNNAIIIGISLAVALVSGIVAFFIPGGIVIATMTFATVFMLSAPAMIILTHKLPFYHATREVNREKCALIGEKSFFDYAGVDVITFDDTEIFTKEDVNLQRVMVYGRKENLPKALQQMSSIFSVTGGPLAFIFADALDRRVSPADNVSVELDGVMGDVGGVGVMAGSAQFMERHGIKIPADTSSEASVLTTTRIMYAAEDGEVYAKFYIRYMLSEDFSMMLPSLADEGIRPLVYTRDPNIDSELLRALTAGSDSISILKKQNLPSDETVLYRKISLGMVGLGEKTNLINAILISRKYTAFQSRMAITELIATVVGAILAIVIVLCNLSAISSAILGVWHIAWCVAVFLMGKYSFPSQKDKNTGEE